jgi:hypothetical protein
VSIKPAIKSSGIKSSIATSAVLVAYLSGCVAPEHLGESATHQSVITDCSSLPQTSPIDPAKELIIEDLSVVEDPCRTVWANPACDSAILGKWTFGRLMTAMSGATDINSPTARSFVNQWLQSWLTNQDVGIDTVATRPLIGPVLLFRWLAASGCASPAQTVRVASQWLNALQACTTLNLQAAPFRLSAIVNRIDLDGRDYSGQNGAPGELRFVFGAINTANQQPVNAAMILEYRFPDTLPPFLWAILFHQLSSADFGPAFASQLQSLTDMVVETGAQPGGPNGGSSIGQVRTNENAFDVAQQWEFRQFGLSCTVGPCSLAQVPVSQTPSTGINNTQLLTNFLVSNKDAIRTSHHVVPPSILGGSSLSFNQVRAVIWNTADDGNGGHTLVDPSDPDFSYNVRHNFAFSTCNGCHYLETLNQNQNFHVAPRAAGRKAQLSSFLGTSLAPDPANPGYPSNSLEVPDPNPDSFDIANGTPYYFQYNEIWRRSCEIRRVLAGIPSPFTTPTGHN